MGQSLIGKQWIWRYPVFRQSVVYVSEIFIHGAHDMYIYINAYLSIGHLGIARIYCELVQIVSSHEHGRQGGPIACWLHLVTMWSSAHLKIKELYIRIYIYIYGYRPFKRSLGWNSWMDYTDVYIYIYTCNYRIKFDIGDVAFVCAMFHEREFWYMWPISQQDIRCYIWYTWPWVHPGQSM